MGVENSMSLAPPPPSQEEGNSSSPSQEEGNSSPPSQEESNSSPPPPGNEDTSSPSPTPPSSSISSPPPPNSSPPPSSEFSYPPPPEERSSPPEERSSPPPPSEDSSHSPPPPPQESTPASPPQDTTPVTPPSDRSPDTPPSGNPPSPPSGSGNPPSGNPTPVNSPPQRERNFSSSSSPPPPASSRLSPPSRSSSSGSSQMSPPDSSLSSSSSSSVSAGVIVAAVVIAVGILAALVICLVCAARKKKKRRYYMDTPASTRAKGDYYNGSNWNTPQNLRPPPGQMGTPPGGIPTWAPPPPPIAAHTSSEYSYSGGPPHAQPTTPSPNMALSNQSSFSFEALAQATNGFSQENLLGQGGFGYVHKGVLPSGKEVAVKSLKSGSGQGEREFQAEVEIISRVHHRHLVSLVGYCIADAQKMLVYEFVSNKTMEFHLHGTGRPTMDWPTRMRIALGAAKGLGYLHEDCHPRIIHRDIKAANILLDDNFEAMVADFGLAKLTSDNYTHVSTRVMGTFGYMAPEYASSGKLTDKSDVFSFGVMLLELITGRRPIDLTNKSMEDSLVDWARPILARVLDNGNLYEEIVDPRLGNNFDPHEMDRMMACAAASIRHSARRRPKMSQIVRSLEGDQSSLDDTAIKPGQTPETTTYDTTAYNADMMKFKKMVMNSNGYGSSEFEKTSEYGLNPSSSSSELGTREYTNSALHRQRL